MIVAHEMQDKTVTREHGGPVRLYVAPMYGYKSLKWLERIEVTNELDPGIGKSSDTTSTGGWARAMAATTTRRVDTAALPLERFDRVERAVHWTNATLILAMLVTGSFLYFGPLSAIVGRRETIKTIHVYCGLAFPIPLLLGLLLGRRFRADARRLNRFDAEDWKWLRSRGTRGRVAKFNAGQKLNAAFVAGAIPVMLATGSIMRWFKPFPLSWRTGATFVHDWVFLALLVVVIGHIGKALADPTALKGMISGRVPRRGLGATGPAVGRGARGRRPIGRIARR